MYILIIHTNRLRRYKYILYARLKLPECIKSIESASQLVGCLRYVGFCRTSTCRLLTKRWFRRVGDSTCRNPPGHSLIGF
jgi:hypothetical protein